MSKVDTESREQLAEILDSAVYQNALENLRDIVRRRLLRILGGDWERIHNDLGMYTMNCRAKSTQRTLEKFDSLLKKGKRVSARNFFRHMPDLVGGRLVVVDPGHLLKLAELVKKGCQPPVFDAPPNSFKTARVRKGKFSMYDTAGFTRAGYTVNEEPAGYCSVHFIYRLGTSFFDELCHDAELKSLKRLDSDGTIPLDGWLIEIQVRTMMDEAWGEVDHFVRYEDPLLRQDQEITAHFAALSAYLQAANHHVSVIRDAAQRKKRSVK